MQVTVEIPTKIWERLVTETKGSPDEAVTFAIMDWLADQAAQRVALDAVLELPKSEQRQSRWNVGLRRLKEEKRASVFSELWDEGREERPDWFPF